MSTSLKLQIEEALKQAMRDRNEVQKRTLRMVIAAMKLAQVGRSEPLTDEEVLAILQKEVKSRQETIREAERANRADMVRDAEDEIAVLKTFLPQAMPADELDALVRQVIADLGVADLKQMGAVVKETLARAQGRAPGGEVSAAVRKALQG